MGCRGVEGDDPGFNAAMEGMARSEKRKEVERSVGQFEVCCRGCVVSGSGPSLQPRVLPVGHCCDVEGITEENSGTEIKLTRHLSLA